MLIFIGKNVWACADAFVESGAKIGEGLVIGARSLVYKNIEPWFVHTGNSAKKIMGRILE